MDQNVTCVVEVRTLQTGRIRRYGPYGATGAEAIKRKMIQELICRDRRHTKEINITYLTKWTFRTEP